MNHFSTRSLEDMRRFALTNRIGQTQPLEAASQRRQSPSEPVFPVTDQSTVLGCWAVPCGTGNLLAILWRDANGPLQARFRYENEGRKQIVIFPTHASLEATILAIKERVAAFSDWMEEAAGEPFDLYERLGPMTVLEILDWLRETGDFIFVERKS
jgi:hypothetical protein